MNEQTDITETNKDELPSSEMNENQQEDAILSLQDIIEEEEQLNEKAKALLGGQDSSVCTYPEGYVPRQTLFACLTCTPEGVNAGVCFGCSLHCHEGHKIVELYTKRKFRCDCGNQKFGNKKCSLYEDKLPENSSNLYNENFRGRFCSCLVFFPDTEDSTDMFQCVKCEDWFHMEHCGADFNVEAWSSRKENDDMGGTMICANCSPSMRLLHKLQTTTEKVCLANEEEDATLTGPIIFPDNWRSFLCSCSYCKDKLDELGMPYFLEEEDDIERFEENNLKLAKSDPTDDQLVNALVESAGRDSAVNVIRGFNDLKRQLGGFFTEKAEAGGVVTKEDIDTFFAGMKKKRFQ